MFLNHLKDGEMVLKQLTIRNESTDEMLKMMKKEQAALKHFRSVDLNR